MRKFFYLRLALVCCTLFYTSALLADDKILNVYAWFGEIPDSVIRQFETETGIKVNFSTYESNEVMYAKLKADKNASYDVVEPTSYFVDRMRREDMLEKFDPKKMPHFQNLDPTFLKHNYDPKSEYSLPFIWGVTGIFVNKDYYSPQNVAGWIDFWNPKYKNQILMFDDAREAFAIALRVLGYSANDNHPEHIREAYLKLKTLLPNVKIFNSSVISLLIDEDATLGMAWNGDYYKAKKENPALDFIFPKEGFIIWVDNFAIPKNAPHRDNAYRFLDFLLRADVAKTCALDNNFATANGAARELLPESIKKNPAIYPPKAILNRGEFQTDLGDHARALYESYWERLKMEG